MNRSSHIGMPEPVNHVQDLTENEVDLVVLFKVFWNAKWKIFGSAFLGLICAIYYIYWVAVPTYKSTATIALETNVQNIVDIASVLESPTGASEEINTEVYVLRSRKLIGALADQLNLIEDPEFNYTLREPTMRAKLRRLILGPLDEPTAEEIRRYVIDSARDKFTIVNVSRSYVFNITATTEGPAKSALLANTLAEIYIADALEEKFAATEKASAWLSQKAAELKIQLDENDSEVKEFTDNTRLQSEASLANMQRQLKDMRERLLEQEEKVHAAALRVSNLEYAVNTRDPAQVADAFDDAELRLLARSAQQDPDQIEAFIARVEFLLEGARAAESRFKLQLDGLKSSEARLQSEVSAQSNDLSQIQQLRREQEATGLLYQSFLARLKETAVQKGLQEPDSRLLSEAVPRDASSPRKNIIYLGFFIIGGFLGGLAVLIRELIDKRFRSTSDLEDFAKISVFGTIPSVEGSERLDILDYAKSKPTSIFAEAIRNLRTSILMSRLDKAPQVLLMTSSLPSEGKTTTTLTTALNMVGMGKKVLVIEGDVRKRVFSNYFNLEDKNGMISVLSGQSKLSDVIFKSERFGFDVLIGEQSTVNAADIFSSQKFKDMLDALREDYDFILIDSAPVLAVPDARVIAQYADAITYCVRWNFTTKAQLKTGLGMFASIGLPVDGLVLTNVNLREVKKRGLDGQYGYDYDEGYHQA